MSLPYANCTSGKNALREINKVLKAFGCKRCASGEDFDEGEVFVQFEFQGRMVNVKASAKGYARAWLKENPWGYRRRLSEQEHERKALAIASTAVWSILRDWVKGQVVAVETGVLTFDGAFLGQIQLPSGSTVIEELERREILPALPEAT